MSRATRRCDPDGTCAYAPPSGRAPASARACGSSSQWPPGHRDTRQRPTLFTTQRSGPPTWSQAYGGTLRNSPAATALWRELTLSPVSREQRTQGATGPPKDAAPQCFNCLQYYGVRVGEVSTGPSDGKGQFRAPAEVRELMNARCSTARCCSYCVRQEPCRSSSSRTLRCTRPQG